MAPRELPVAACIVDCAVYIDGERVPGPFSPEAALAEVRRRGEGFCRLGLYEPDSRQMECVAAIFEMHPLAVEDTVHAHQRPKLERYDDALFLVLRTVVYVEHEATASCTTPHPHRGGDESTAEGNSQASPRSSHSPPCRR